MDFQIDGDELGDVISEDSTEFLRTRQVESEKKGARDGRGREFFQQARMHIPQEGFSGLFSSLFGVCYSFSVSFFLL